MTHNEFLEALAVQNALFAEIVGEKNRILDDIRHAVKEKQEQLNICLAELDRLIVALEERQ